MQQFERLLQLVARLRGEDGCPWDRQQTHQSLQQYLVEETYEALEAIDAADAHQLCGELGDVLLQVALHAQIATEHGEFDMDDVLRGINEKLVHRHPHVFTDVSVSGAAEVVCRWEHLKQTNGQGTDRESVLDGTPKALPALQRAHRLQHKAAQVGFDWEDTTGPWAKVSEELQELEEAVHSRDREHITHEIGDVLIAVVNLARLLEVSAEEALRVANNRFEARFRALEQRAAEQGRELTQMTLAEMDELWEQVKIAEANAD